MGNRGVLSGDFDVEEGIPRRRQSRRTMELLPPAMYGTLSYWAKWACASAAMALQNKLFTQAELDEALGGGLPQLE